MKSLGIETKLWILLLFLSLMLVFVAYYLFNQKINYEMADAQNAEVFNDFDYAEQDYDVQSNKTLEEHLFEQLDIQRNLLKALIFAISLAFVAGFIIKFFWEKRRENKKE